MFALQLNVGGAKDWYCQPLVSAAYRKSPARLLSWSFYFSSSQCTHLSEIRYKYIPVKLTDKHWLPGLYQSIKSHSSLFPHSFPRYKTHQGLANYNIPEQWENVCNILKSLCYLPKALSVCMNIFTGVGILVWCQIFMFRITRNRSYIVTFYLQCDFYMYCQYLF